MDVEKVQAVEGWSLRVPPEVMQRIGGSVHAISEMKYSWRPNPGDNLYYLGRWQGEVNEGDYYVLQRQDGEKVFLECLHPIDPPSVLVILRDNRVPQWVLEAAAEVCEEPHVSSQGDE